MKQIDNLETEIEINYVKNSDVDSKYRSSS